MDGSSLEGLVSWMRDSKNDVMHRWGCIAVLARKQLNEVLVQNHIASHTADTGFRIDAAVDTIPGKQKDILSGFLLDAPQLSFERAERDHASLSCPVTAGSWLLLVAESQGWHIQKVTAIDPLTAPRVLLNVDLTTASGDVDDDGRILLDLRSCDDFRFMGADTEEQQKRIGQIFQNWFKGQPDDKRILELGSIGGEGGGLMTPDGFTLRAQKNPAAGRDNDGDGAVLVCINMAGQDRGDDFPADYPYFIPDDVGEQYSATVLFDQATTPFALFAAIEKAFGGQAFSFAYDAQSSRAEAKLTSGELSVPPMTIEQTDPDTGYVVVCVIEKMKFPATVEQPLVLGIEGTSIHITWSSAASATMRMSAEDQSEEDSITFGVSLRLDATYELQGLTFSRTAYTLDKTYVAPADLDLARRTGWFWSFIEQVILDLVHYAFLETVSESIDPMFETTFSAGTGAEAFLKDNIKVGADQFIESQSLHIPRDVVIFGRVNPTLTTFVINPLQPIMAAGGSQQFSTQPGVAGVIWSLEDPAGGGAGLGSINSAGLYKAPGAETSGPAINRIRVVATHNGHSSAALVTVLEHRLNISPLIQVCNAGETVELAGGALDDAALQWTVRNPVAGESGTLEPGKVPGHDCSYVAAARVPDKTYVIDELQVSSAGETRSAWVLVRQIVSPLTVRPFPDVNLSAGQIRLRAFFDSDEAMPVSWRLPLEGPGSLDAEGIYTAPQGTDDRFVLIFASYDDAFLGDIEGHIILPLPLEDFPDELGLLSVGIEEEEMGQKSLLNDPSLEGLVQWMAKPDSNVMWGWGAICAMARGKINDLLLQEYTARFDSDTYLPPISGEVSTVNGVWKESIHDFILDAPRLAFTNDDLGRSRATLKCSIYSGTQFTLHNNVDVWQVEKAVYIDPLQGPELTLDLQLDQVPGLVESDGRVRLDLKDSDNFTLSFADTEYERKLGGDFFSELFNKLPDSQRIWTLGVIQKNSNPLLAPASFKLRTQSDPMAARDGRAASFGDGALLVFIRMEGSSEGGDIPVEYAYLIPNDQGKDYSATVLLEAERAFDAARFVETVAEAIKARFEAAKFDYKQNADGVVINATATSGLLNFPTSSQDLLPSRVDGVLVTPHIYWNGAQVDIARSQPMVLELAGRNRVLLKWKDSLTIANMLELKGIQFPPIVFAEKISIDVTVQYSFNDETGELILKPELNLDVSSSDQDIGIEPGAPTPSLALMTLIMAAGYAASTSSRALFITRITDILESTFNASVQVSGFIRESVQLNFNRAVTSDVLRAPRDFLSVGRVAAVADDFVVTPQEHLMAADSSMKFTTDPPEVDVQWSIENLYGESEDFGAISGVGKYYAPEASSLEKSFTRIRVTATDPATGHASSALVTVLANALTVNPLIQVCDALASVELAAGALGGGDLEWRIDNFVEGESGELQFSEQPGSDHNGNRAYLAAPAVRGKTYVLDEVVVTGVDGCVSAWVLVQQKPPGLVIKHEEAGLTADSIHLLAFANGKPLPPDQVVNWSIGAHGPGSISETGTYLSDPQSSERFVLIFARWEHPILGAFEGHIILPLPLRER
ncbi:hypothetical protein [Pseudomonas viridiflava]|nr:hypothetical protein [Pseudomonas viridiflava]